MYRHHPQSRLIQEYVQSGKLGEVSLVRSAFSFFMQNPTGNVRMNPDYGGGALWDVGIYPVSFAQMVYGEKPQSLSGWQWIGKTGVDESFAGQLNYSGGRSAQIAGGFRIPFYTVADIHGTAGRLTLNRPYIGMNEKDHELIYTPVDGKPHKLRVKAMDPYLGEVEDMHAAILDGKAPLISLQESRNHVQVTCALYEAARSGQTVQVD
jgi:predicted dehydrogenase